ncbi:hypothetical protein ACFPYJ_20465 [Paenibacillus solisilvae]|uniref:DUF5668 domain-containing protein n=1 Tax=Paenibacillus solisilvae TaxID=2486751 RepID=A0ABW0W0F5_9BACL
MKRWRVGTLSMGLSLILIGITLMISTWSQETAIDTLLKWWPVVFILLGLEIVVFIALKNKEQPVIHYDIFSILFVGVLCCICAGFALAASSGLTRELQYALGSEDRTFDIPAVEQPVPAKVTRIVVETHGTMPKIDKIGTREVHLFGSYRIRHNRDEKNAPLKADDITSILTIDQTMYISIKELPQRIGLNESSPSASLTMAFPRDVSVEVRDANDERIP